MIKFVKLTAFDIDTDWEDDIPTNKEKYTDIYINVENITYICLGSFYVPLKGESTYIPKTSIRMHDYEFYVNESIEDVLTKIHELG